jgi:O-antigen ligase
MSISTSACSRLAMQWFQLMPSIGAAAFAVLVGILTCIFPMLSLYLFVLVSPFGALNDVLGWDPRVRWALILSLRAAWEWWKTGITYVPYVAGKIWIGFVIFAALGLRVGAADLLPDDAAEARSMLLYFVAGSAAMYAIWQLVRTKRQRQILFAVFAASVVIASTVGIVQAVVGYGSADASGRITGALRNSNYFATYLALAATTLALMIRSRVMNRWYGYLVCALAALACALTLSRSGAVATIVGLSLAASLRRHKRILSLRVLGIMTAAGLVGVGLLTSYILESRRGITYSADSTTQSFETIQAAEDLSRLEAFQYSVQLTGEHPLAGVGFGTFQSRNYVKNGLYVATHNTVMQVLAGTGVVGGILMVLVIIFLIRPLPVPARRYLFPAAAAFGICALFGDYLQSLEISVIFGVVYLSARHLGQAERYSDSTGDV